MTMRRFTLAALAAAMCSVAGAAEVSLEAARVAGKDVPALAKFYQAAFGLHEVDRLQIGGHVQIMLNFGADAAAAKASPAAQVVLMYREVDSDTDPVPHLIFHVADLKATMQAVTAAGGKMGQPIAFAGMQLGFGTDPAGNRFELIQRAAAK